MKFGGTSVGDAECIRRAAEIVANATRLTAVAVVVSVDIEDEAVSLLFSVEVEPPQEIVAEDNATNKHSHRCLICKFFIGNIYFTE